MADVNGAESIVDRVAALASRLERIVIRLLRHGDERLTTSEAQEYVAELLDAIIAAKSHVDVIPDRSPEWRTRKHAEFDSMYRVLVGSIGAISQ
jgi:hypothetical protein